MHSVDLLEEALRVAMNSGFEVRQEWLHERGGGACRIGNRWVLFVDLSLPAPEQLVQVIEALRTTRRFRLEDTDCDQLRCMLRQPGQSQG